MTVGEMHAPLRFSGAVRHLHKREPVGPKGRDAPDQKNALA